MSVESSSVVPSNQPAALPHGRAVQKLERYRLLTSSLELSKKRVLPMETSVSSKERKRRIKVPRCEVLKEKRARFYIIRQCLYMLICWREHAD
ncbi:hypothetical protein ACJIZ3_003798 [Penstemon smallii]|uniref:Uncharacterized protein n=1 Tax=Penstemon smallii TaxID=265156 RepID=A0ABD3S099_9LAMI